jgi:hypothetical protein
VVADAFDTAVVGDDAATVAVDQPDDELLGRLVDEILLPRFEGDASEVLPPRTVLRKQTGPMFRVEGDFDTFLFLTIPAYWLSIRNSMASRQRSMIAGYLLSSAIRNRQTRRSRDMQPSPR